MDTRLEQLLLKLKCVWSNRPTDETTALLIHSEDSSVRVYLELLSTKQLRFLKQMLPPDFAVFKFRVFFQTPGRDKEANVPGFVAFNLEEFTGSENKPVLFGIAHIPLGGAWANGGNWKKRAVEKLTAVGKLPDGLLFDSGVIIDDVKDYIDGL